MCCEVHFKVGQGCDFAMQDFDIGQTLRGLPVAVLRGEGGCKTLFVHAGLPPGLLTQLELHRTEMASPEELLQDLNDAAKGKYKLVRVTLPCLIYSCTAQICLHIRSSCQPQKYAFVKFSLLFLHRQLFIALKVDVNARRPRPQSVPEEAIDLTEVWPSKLGQGCTEC